MHRTFFFSLMLALGLAACGSDEEAFENVKPTLASLQSDVFNKTCLDSGCHSATDAEGGLVLEAGRSHAAMVAVTSQTNRCNSLNIVEPGEPNQSVLLLKLTGTECGTRMPQGRAALPANVVDAVRTWIADGAQP